MDVNSAKGSMATSLAQFARFSYRWGLHPGDREREREGATVFRDQLFRLKGCLDGHPKTYEVRHALVYFSVHLLLAR